MLAGRFSLLLFLYAINYHRSIFSLIAPCVRTGSISCFNSQARRWNGESGLITALRESDSSLQSWITGHPRYQTIVHTCQLLIRAPDRFTAAHFIALTEQGFTPEQTFSRLARCGLSGWLNRLKIGLGDTLPD